MMSPISIKNPSAFKASGITSHQSIKKSKSLTSHNSTKSLMKTIEVDDLPELILTKPPPPVSLKHPTKKNNNGMF